MNTYGPSSRPRKPYPLALLNHFTVPFKRSATCAPYFLRIPPEKARFPGPQEMCRNCAAHQGNCQGLASHIAGWDKQGLGSSKMVMGWAFSGYGKPWASYRGHRFSVCVRTSFRTVWWNQAQENAAPEGRPSLAQRAGKGRKKDSSPGGTTEFSRTRFSAAAGFEIRPSALRAASAPTTGCRRSSSRRECAPGAPSLSPLTNRKT